MFKARHLGERVDRAGYLPDRAIALLIALFQFCSIPYLLWSYTSSWNADPQRSTLSLLDWISQRQYWNGLGESVRLLALSLWCAAGIAKSRRWALVLLAFACSQWLIMWAGRIDEASAWIKAMLLLYLGLLSYCVLRLIGSLGPKAFDAAGGRDSA